MKLGSLGHIRLGMRLALLVLALLGLALLTMVAGTPAAHAQTPGYLQVSAGLFHTCAIQGVSGEVGSVQCWGYNDYGEASSPAGDFEQVSAGGYHTCALKPDGYVQCWGSNEVLLECTETGCVYLWGGQASPPNIRFKQISAGVYHTCGVTLDGNVDCWGYNPHGETADRSGGNWLEVSAGEFHTCALRSDGVVDCWGDNANGRAADQIGPFTQVSAGGSHNCAIRKSDGKAECWGGDAYGQSSPPNVALAQISAGNLHTCGILAEGNGLVCWGYNFYGQVKQAPAGQFKQVDSGQGHSCAVSVTNELYCWGRNDYRQATVPGVGGPGSGKIFAFAGFYQPVVAPPRLNVLKAGSSVPLKFSLGGDQGLKVIELDYPASGPLNCKTMDPGDDLKPTVAAGASALAYDPTTGQYTYVWKTEKTWAGTCRYLSLRLVDGTEHRAAFQFNK